MLIQAEDDKSYINSSIFYYYALKEAGVPAWEMLANKACWAIEADPKRPGKVKIVDQEHAAELLELAKENLVEITQAEAYAPIYVRLAFTPN